MARNSVAARKNSGGGKVSKLQKSKLAARAKKVVAQATKPKKQLSQKQREKLIIEHMESCRRLAWSFLNRWRVRIEEDEVQSIAGAALCEAANRFDPNYDVSFGTFLFYHLRGMLLKEITARVQDSKLLARVEEGVSHEEGHHHSSDQVFVQHETPEDLVQRQERSRICWEACQKLDSLEQEVVIRCFVYEQSVVDIAKELGYCRCHISRVKSKALATLSKHLHQVSRGEEDLGSFGKLLISSQAARSYRGGRGRRKSSLDELQGKQLSKPRLAKLVAAG